MLVLVVLLGLVVLLLAVLVVGLLRSHAEILRRLHELGAGVYEGDEQAAGDPGMVGATTGVAVTDKPDIRTVEGVAQPRPGETPAFDLTGTTPDGRAKAVGVVGVEHSTLLVFLTSGCGTCAGFWQAFGRGEASGLPGRDTRLVIVTKGANEESPSAISELAPAAHVTLMSTSAFDDYGVPVSPYLILVDGPEGRVVGEGAAASWDQVANLLRQAAADAGIDPTGSGAADHRERTSRRRRDGAAREQRADADLLAAGITPGHASLYPDRVTEPVPDEDR